MPPKIPLRRQFGRRKWRSQRAKQLQNKEKEDTSNAAEIATENTEYQLRQSPLSPSTVTVSEVSSSIFTLNSSPEIASSFLEVPCPSAALLTAALRKISCQLPPNWLSTADSKGFYVLLLNSGDVRAIQRQIFVSFLGNASVHVQCYPCPLFDEVFSLLHSPKVFSSGTLDEYCNSVLSLVKIVMQYTHCIGVSYEDMKKVRGDHPEIRIDSHPFLEAGCKDTCRSSSCALLVPHDTDDVRCDACVNLLEWVNDRISEEL